MAPGIRTCIPKKALDGTKAYLLIGTLRPSYCGLNFDCLTVAHTEPQPASTSQHRSVQEAHAVAQDEVLPAVSMN